MSRVSWCGSDPSAAATQIWYAHNNKRAYDAEQHRAALAALPESWERERPGGPTPSSSRAAHAAEAKRRRKAERAARKRQRRRLSDGRRRVPSSARRRSRFSEQDPYAPR